ncbi:MAG: hypothetical protein IJ079_06465 [Lachnospiraceae bacterium]|nr:hypothetical protein [Lachnospiraceae bacterium]
MLARKGTLRLQTGSAKQGLHHSRRHKRRSRDECEADGLWLGWTVNSNYFLEIIKQRKEFLAF